MRVNKMDEAANTTILATRTRPDESTTKGDHARSLALNDFICIGKVLMVAIYNSTTQLMDNVKSSKVFIIYIMICEEVAGWYSSFC
jgi:hypothetical protein